jgi:hypothetical protein
LNSNPPPGHPFPRKVGRLPTERIHVSLLWIIIIIIVVLAVVGFFGRGRFSR